MIGLATGPALRHVANELRHLVRRHRSGPLKMSVSTTGELEPPDVLIEPSDMAIVASPCHPWEPVKIADYWRAPVHCLVCGQTFVV